MSNPSGEKSKLDAKTLGINNALDELVQVLVGNSSSNSNGASFSPDEVWADIEVESLSAHGEAILGRLRTQSVDADMRETIVALFGAAAGSNPVSALLKKGLEALQEQMGEFNKLKDGVMGDKLDAFNRLNNDHPTIDPSTDYGGGSTGSETDYGFIPAIEDVINSISGGNADLDDLLNEIKAMGALLNQGEAYVLFASYFAGTVGLLNKALFG